MNGYINKKSGLSVRKKGKESVYVKVSQVKFISIHNPQWMSECRLTKLKVHFFPAKQEGFQNVLITPPKATVCEHFGYF